MTPFYKKYWTVIWLITIKLFLFLSLFSRKPTCFCFWFRSLACTVCGNLWRVQAILSDLPLYQLRYWNYLLPSNTPDGPWPESHFGLWEALSSSALSQARVWLLLGSLAMAAWGSLLKFNMVLNQIYKCLGVLWKTHTQPVLVKPECVCARVCVSEWKLTETVCVCVCEIRKVCVLFVCALWKYCLCQCFPSFFFFLP